MRVAILGSTFNPPHWGHLSVAQQVLDFCPVDRVWLMPTFIYNPQLKKNLVGFNHRLNMVRYLERPRIKVSDFEKYIKGPSYTFQVLKGLKKRYPQIDFSFVIGADWVAKFSQWYRWQDILNICKFYVFPRKNIGIQLLKNMQLVASPLLKTTTLSSSQIRKNLSLGKTIDGLVPQEVADYIQRNRLYCG